MNNKRKAKTKLLISFLFFILLCISIIFYFKSSFNLFRTEENVDTDLEINLKKEEPVSTQLSQDNDAIIDELETSEVIKKPEHPKEIDRSDIRLEVLNGCGKKDIAKEVTTIMRGYGYDVVNVGNADSFHYDVTIIIDRVGAIEFAKDVAKTLDTDNYIQQIDKNRLLEVSVIIGNDFLEIFPQLKGNKNL